MSQKPMTAAEMAPTGRLARAKAQRKVDLQVGQAGAGQQDLGAQRLLPTRPARVVLAEPSAAERRPWMELGTT